jgi:hypothetical protein
MPKYGSNDEYYIWRQMVVKMGVCCSNIKLYGSLL